MAPAISPLNPSDHDFLEQQLKDVIQDLYQLMIQVSTYDTTPRPSKEVLANGVKSLSQSLKGVHAAAISPNLPRVPPELIQYVENGRNPDIYTREFVELVRRGNQLMRGKLGAFAQFRDVLAEQIGLAMPELRDDVRRVLAVTSGGGGGDGYGDRDRDGQVSSAGDAGAAAGAVASPAAAAAGSGGPSSTSSPRGVVGLGVTAAETS